MERLNFYKELYYKEDERKNAINSSISIPITVITALSAWLLYFYHDKIEPFKSQSLLLKILFALSFATLLVSVFLIIIGLFLPKLRKKFPFLTSGYDYEYMPAAKDCEDFYQKEVQLRRQSKYATMAISDSDKQFENMITISLVSAATHNRELNENKTDRLSLGRFFLILSLFFNLILLISSIIDETPSPEKIQKIEIVNPVKIKDTAIINILKSINENKKDTFICNKSIKNKKYGNNCKRCGRRGKSNETHRSS